MIISTGELHFVREAHYFKRLIYIECGAVLVLFIYYH